MIVSSKIKSPACWKQAACASLDTKNKRRNLCLKTENAGHGAQMDLLPECWHSFLLFVRRFAGQASVHHTIEFLRFF